MTLKQDNLVKAIPQAKTLRQAGMMAGYSPKSRTIYRKGTKTHIAENLQLAGITKQSLQDYFIGLGQLALQAGDISNAERSGENIAKMAGFMKDNAVQGVTVHINDAISQLKGNITGNQKLDTPCGT